MMGFINSEFFGKAKSLAAGTLAGVVLFSGLIGCAEEPPINYLEVKHEFTTNADFQMLYEDFSTSEELEEALLASGLYSSEEIAKVVAAFREMEKAQLLQTYGVEINSKMYLLASLHAHVLYIGSNKYWINICQYNRNHYVEIETETTVCQGMDSILMKHCHYKITDLIPDDRLFEDEVISYEELLYYIKLRYAEDVLYAESREFTAEGIANMNIRAFERSLVKQNF